MKALQLILCSIVISVLAAVPATADEYSFDLSLDPNSLELTGTVSITAQDGIPNGTTLLMHGASTTIISILVSDEDIQYQTSDSGTEVDFPTSVSGNTMEVTFRYQAQTEAGGIFYFPDDANSISWFPRLNSNEASTHTFSARISYQGPGAVVHPLMQISGDSSSVPAHRAVTFPLVYSPIFNEKRISVAECNLALYAREGSDPWAGMLLDRLSEVYDFLAASVPSFQMEQMNVVFGGALPSHMTSAGLALVEDDLEELASQYGAVFASHYLRWKAATALSEYFVHSNISPTEDNRWYTEGLALYLAQQYAIAARLTGPDFDNVKYEYLRLAQQDEAVRTASPMFARSKGFWAVQMLADILGRNRFRTFLRDTMEYGFSEDVELAGILDSYTDEHINLLIDRWLIEGGVIDYAITDIRGGPGSYRVHLESHGDVIFPVELVATWEDATQEVHTVMIPTDGLWVDLKTNKQLSSVRLDPDERQPDIKRSDNRRSLGSSRRINALYKIDEILEIGDLEITSDPLSAGDHRTVTFRLTVSNKRESNVFLAIRLTTVFPGGRNRGLTRFLVELGASETRTLQETMKIPGLGFGNMEILARYYLLSSREAFASLNNASIAALTSHFIVDVPK